MASAETQAIKHERDFYGWALQQADWLRSGRLQQVDPLHLSEEIESLARSEYDKLASALAIALLHLLKLRFQPSRQHRSWFLSIDEHRDRVDRVLRNNPSLRPRRGEAIADAYRSARRMASAETEIALDVFPEVCPFDWEAIQQQPLGTPD